MKRDLDLIRKILLRIEEKSTVPPRLLQIADFRDLCDNPYLISLHIGLLADAGLVETVSESYLDDLKDYDISRLTNAGYDYLDAVRDACVWQDVRNKLLSVGGSAAYDVVKAVALPFIKERLGI